MKFLTSILLLYVLALIAIPCFDVPHDDHTRNTEISQNSNTHSHNGDDLCSPFCACSCCVSHIVSPDYIIQVNTFLPSQDYYSCYITSCVSSLFTSIWQPPELS